MPVAHSRIGRFLLRLPSAAKFVRSERSTPVMKSGAWMQIGPVQGWAELKSTAIV